MAEVEAGPVGRKERSKLKKAAKEQERAAKKIQQKQVDQILDELFDQIETEKRDLARYLGHACVAFPAAHAANGNAFQSLTAGVQDEQSAG